MSITILQSVWWSLFFLTLLRFCAVVGVTVHVLLTRLNSSAAVGWIGICWFSPLLGACLYCLFGINRVRRRAIRLMSGEHAERHPFPEYFTHKVEGRWEGLENMGEKITGRQLLKGNSTRLYYGGSETYPQMLQGIARAEKSVLMASYIFRGDEEGELFVSALVAAHKAGVKVRILIDGVGSGYFNSRIRKSLKKHGIPCERFLHSFLLWKTPFVNLRNHRKLLIIDGKEAFVGGINIGSENLESFYSKKKCVADTHFHVQGPIARQLVEVFERDWAFTTKEHLRGLDFYPEIDFKGDVPMRVITSGPDTDLEKLEYILLQAISSAHKKIMIMTPYFLPDSRLITALGLASLRGTKVDIFFPEKSNHRFLDFARDSGIFPLLQAGCRVWRVPAPFNHSKLMVVDSLWNCIGSANWDSRSLRLNFEVNLEIYSGELAVDLENYMYHFAVQPFTLEDLKKRPILLQLRDSACRLLSPYL
ncbi:cardiolipin synthase [Acetobacteraceae bacterium]|nr:cardiolipin synthase [Acetobacteraceae bacterium]